jgi:Pentapeptide repeats (8 copies)
MRQEMVSQDFTGQNLRGRSFRGQDLRGANFSHADIRGADFSHANLTGANLSHAKIGRQLTWLSFGIGIALLIGTITLFMITKDISVDPSLHPLDRLELHEEPSQIRGLFLGEIVALLGALLIHSIKSIPQFRRRIRRRDEFIREKTTLSEVLLPLVILVTFVLTIIALKEIANTYAALHNFDSFGIYPLMGFSAGFILTLIAIIAGTGALERTNIEINPILQLLRQAFLFAFAGLAVSLILTFSRFYLLTLNPFRSHPFNHHLFFAGIYFFIAILPMLSPGMVPELSDDKMSASYSDETSLYVGCIIIVLFSVLFGSIAVQLGKKHSFACSILSYLIPGLCFEPYMFSVLSSFSNHADKADKAGFGFDDAFNSIKTIILFFALLFIPFLCSSIAALVARGTSFYKANLHGAHFTGILRQN